MMQNDIRESIFLHDVVLIWTVSPQLYVIFSATNVLLFIRYFDYVMKCLSKENNVCEYDVSLSCDSYAHQMSVHPVCLDNTFENVPNGTETCIFAKLYPNVVVSLRKKCCNYHLDTCYFFRKYLFISFLNAKFLVIMFETSDCVYCYLSGTPPKFLTFTYAVPWSLHCFKGYKIQMFKYHAGLRTGTVRNVFLQVMDINNT